MKRIITAVVLALALALSLGITACGQDTNKQAGGTGGGKFDELTTAESVYGFSAASAGMLISSMNGGSAARLASAKGLSVTDAAPVVPGENNGETLPEAPGADNPQTPPEVPGEGAPENPGETEPETPNGEISELDRYMALVESLLSDGGFQTVSQTSDKPEYSEKMIVSYKDMQGNALQYIMYYNQELIPSGDNEDDDGDWFEDTETEESYAIRGIMEIDGANYEIVGTRENEADGDEAESETKFRVSLSDTAYMLVEQGHETEGEESEQEYSYSVYEGRTLRERSTFSYETERGETELKMTAYKDGKSETLYFERETVLGKEVIRLRIGSGADRQSYIVHIAENADGSTRYEYEPVNGR